MNDASDRGGDLARRILGLTVLILGVAACRGAPAPNPDQVAAAVAGLRPTIENDAAPIPSELLDRADHYAALAPDGPPRHGAILLHSGEDALTARLHLIRAARHSIYVQVYIWTEDDCGSLLFQECLEAARRGVHVRLLLDQHANRRPHSAAQWAVAHANLEVRYYNPLDDFGVSDDEELFLNAATGFADLNRRMHNKVMLVDGKVALVGGRNIDDCYFDMDPEFAYVDRDVLVLGPAVTLAELSFAEFWRDEVTHPAERIPSVARNLMRLADGTRSPRPDFEAPAKLDWALERASQQAIDNVLPHSTFREIGRVEFVADAPMKRSHPGRSGEEDAMLDLMLGARSSVVLQSNYLVFSRRQLDFLRRMDEERPEVEVTFLTNSLASTGNLLVYGLSRKQRVLMLSRGLRIRQLRPVPDDIRHFLTGYDRLLQWDTALGPEHTPYEDLIVDQPGYGPQICIHAKTLVVDGRIAMVGSHNFDPRSQIFNTEAGFVLHDEALAGELQGELDRMMAPGNSWVVSYKPHVPLWTEWNMMFSSLSRMLPVFDVYPWRGYTCYELRDGKPPLPHDHPDFHDHYRAVGEAPEVPIGWKRFNVSLIGAFVRPIRSLL